MRTTHTLLLLGLPVLMHAQGNAMLTVNDVHALFNANGMIGRDPATGSANYFVPAQEPGPGPSPLYAANLWVGGLDIGDNLHLAATLYDQEGHDFFPGPLSQGTAAIDGATSQAYDRVWSVYRNDVEQHCAYFHCLADPECNTSVEFPDGYVTPAYFFDWPAHGNVDDGQAFNLAPYNDFNGNGSYDPENGDSPCVPGDQALYAIYNDKLAVHTSSGGQAIGLEVHMMPFAYSSGNEAIDRTVFVHYRVINRNNAALHDTYIGLFADFDLGCSTDDLVQCDVGRNLFFGFNADNNDQDCPMAGYGLQPPAFGELIIQGPLMDPDGADNTTTPMVPAFNGHGFDDDIVDNERYGLCRFMTNSAPTAPLNMLTTPAAYYNWMRAIWPDMTPLSYGGTGYSPGPGSTRAFFAFPGGSDPLGVGTDGVPQADQNWTQAGPTGGDQRGLGAMGPFTLGAGAEQDLLVAFVYGRAASGGPLASVQDLLDRTDEAKAFGEALLAQGSMCPCGSGTTGIMDHADSDVLHVYPVPATDAITVRTTTAVKNADVRILDATGKSVARASLTGRMITLPVQRLVQGLYHVTITSADFRSQARFIKQ